LLTLDKGSFPNIPEVKLAELDLEGLMLYLCGRKLKTGWSQRHSYNIYYEFLLCTFPVLQTLEDTGAQGD
jgi:hypothetical protein